MRYTNRRIFYFTLQVTSSDEAAGSDVTSWLGSVTNEEGGASVWFDFPHDDITTVDVRQLKHVVVMATELLCHERKWEKMVDITLRFDAITRYVLSNHRLGPKTPPPPLLGFRR